MPGDVINTARSKSTLLKHAGSRIRASYSNMTALHGAAVQL